MQRNGREEERVTCGPVLDSISEFMLPAVSNSKHWAQPPHGEFVGALDGTVSISHAPQNVTITEVART